MTRKFKDRLTKLEEKTGNDTNDTIDIWHIIIGTKLVNGKVEPARYDPTGATLMPRRRNEEEITIWRHEGEAWKDFQRRVAAELPSRPRRSIVTTFEDGRELSKEEWEAMSAED